MKDDADRRAEELVEKYELDAWLELPGGLAHIIAAAIRAAVADAEERRDRILTDMLSESEASHEMWRQGAEAMEDAVVQRLRETNHLQPPVVFELGTLIPHVRAVPLPQPPSQTADGAVLKPSRVWQERDRYRRALEDVAREAQAQIARIAREALEDTR